MPFTVECSGNAGPATRFRCPTWDAAHARADAERVKPWESVVVRDTATGAILESYRGAAAGPVRRGRGSR